MSGHLVNRAQTRSRLDDGDHRRAIRGKGGERRPVRLGHDDAIGPRLGHRREVLVGPTGFGARSPAREPTAKAMLGPAAPEPYWHGHGPLAGTMASSRSRMTASAPLSRARAHLRSSSAGTNRAERADARALSGPEPSGTVVMLALDNVNAAAWAGR